MMDQLELVLISQGAEGKVYTTDFLSRPTIVKERLSKKYRTKELDFKINKQRMIQETRCMVKCRRGGVHTPSIYLVDTLNSRLYIEKIIGKTVKDLLRPNICGEYPKESVNWAKDIGIAIGKMHDIDVVHGDLTTSNIMVRGDEINGYSEVILIDFGLGQMQSVIEDKAVDLYVLERAFISTHPGSEYLVQIVMESYRFNCRKGTPILNKLEQVRMRGRKREMFG